MGLEDPILRPRSKPLRSQRGTALSKVFHVFGVTASLALLGVTAVLLPSLFAFSNEEHDTVLVSETVRARAAGIQKSSQLLERSHSHPKQSLYHGVVYPPNYYGYYDKDGVRYPGYRYPHDGRVQHISVDDGVIGIGNTGKTWFISHHGAEEASSECTSGCDTAQSRLMTAAGGMMQAAALNDLKRQEAAATQKDITQRWASKMRTALDVLDPPPPAPMAPKGICHTTVACDNCRGITEEEACTEARGVWEPTEDWRGDLHANEQEVAHQLKDRMEEAVIMAGQIPT